jgi:hypothetical protein
LAIIILAGVREQRLPNPDTVTIRGKEQEVAVVFHPCRATVEALAGERAITGSAPLFFHLRDPLPIERREFARLDYGHYPLVRIGRDRGSNVDLLEVSGCISYNSNWRHRAVLKEEAQTNRLGWSCCKCLSIRQQDASEYYKSNCKGIPVYFAACNER